ncbi:hypothetical protein SAMN05192533_102263 [Mesobacillus persicus]|uniref:Uncharacterized protein n=1 Tax=Mesobacillus persicus TaxID=930146 RepID=A0A1H7XLR6_9BACI|nr:hypothetical protein [Mesobacillus persicus]SEM34593.1 hypothetical protein SAMN05192533_102263 [Mesobacillus persicus]
MKKRFTNKIFLLAFVGFLWQILQPILKHYEIEISQELFRQFVDLVCYGVIGFGIYQSFEEPSEPPTSESGE